jgi:hypothetical protein
MADMADMADMAVRDRVLCWTYGVLAFAALIATWSQNIRFFTRAHNGGLWGFIKDGYANPAASSFTNDILMIALVAAVFMVVESRRVGVRHVWAYILLMFVIAASVAFPLFLLARQRKLATQRVGLG